MALTDEQMDIERRDGRVPRAWLAAVDADCECPDVCPIQHDNDN